MNQAWEEGERVEGLARRRALCNKTHLESAAAAAAHGATQGSAPLIVNEGARSAHAASISQGGREMAHKILRGVATRHWCHRASSHDLGSSLQRAQPRLHSCMLGLANDVPSCITWRGMGAGRLSRVVRGGEVDECTATGLAEGSGPRCIRRLHLCSSPQRRTLQQRFASLGQPATAFRQHSRLPTHLQEGGGRRGGMHRHASAHGRTPTQSRPTPGSKPAAAVQQHAAFIRARMGLRNQLVLCQVLCTESVLRLTGRMPQMEALAPRGWSHPAISWPPGARVQGAGCRVRGALCRALTEEGRDHHHGLLVLHRLALLHQELHNLARLHPGKCVRVCIYDNGWERV